MPEEAGAPPAQAAFIQPIVTGILIGTAFLLVFVTALHSPSPRSAPVAVAGPTQVVQTLEGNAALDGFDLQAVAGADEAEKMVRDGDVYAAYVPGDGGGRLLVSSAHGAVATRTIQGVFTGVAAAGGGQLQVQDVVPVDAQDPNGLSVFYLIFGVTLGAFLFGQSGFAFPRRVPTRQRLLQIAAFSVVFGIIATLIARVWIGVLPGNVLAEAGILMLLAAAVGTFTLALTTLLKDWGVAVATILALILGTAVSGGPAPADFLPSGFALFSSVMPPGAAVSALLDIAYFDTGKAIGPLLVLLVWIAASVAVVAGVPALRRGKADGAERPSRDTETSPAAS